MRVKVKQTDGSAYFIRPIWASEQWYVVLGAARTFSTLGWRSPGREVEELTEEWRAHALVILSRAGGSTELRNETIAGYVQAGRHVWLRPRVSSSSIEQCDMGEVDGYVGLC